MIGLAELVVVHFLREKRNEEVDFKLTGIYTFYVFIANLSDFTSEISFFHS